MTPDVLLRDVRADDLPIFFEYQRDPIANDMAAFPARDQEAFTAHWKKIADDASVVAKVIVYAGEVAGHVVSWGPPEERLVGYWIGRDYWGNGIATRALSQFLPLLHERPLFAHVAKHNLASLRVLHKCGFTTAGEAKLPADANGVEIDDLILRLDDGRM